MRDVNRHNQLLQRLKKSTLNRDTFKFLLTI